MTPPSAVPPSAPPQLMQRRHLILAALAPLAAWPRSSPAQVVGVAPARQAIIPGAPTPLPQIGVDSSMADGDRAYSQLHIPEAVAAYQRALIADSNSYAAAWRLAYGLTDLADLSNDGAEKAARYQEAERSARHALELQPQGPDAHFTLARVLARGLKDLDVKTRLAVATEVRAHALAALAADSNHVGALHLLGVWNAEVMRVPRVQRFVAKRFLGGAVLGTASWEEAQRDLVRAVLLDPTRIVHHYELGRVYADRGDRARARAEFERALALPITEISDHEYQAESTRALAALR